MIVKMKKISVIVQARDIDPTLKNLAGLGALHIEHQRPPVNEDIAFFKEKYDSLSRAIGMLPDSDAAAEIHDRPHELIHDVVEMIDKKQILVKGIKNIKKDIGLWEEWGDFDLKIIYELEEKHVSVRLCKLGKKDLRSVPDGVAVEELFRKGNIFYCALVSREKIDLPFNVIKLPSQGLQDMKMDLERETKKLAETEAALADMSKYKTELLSYKKKLNSIIEFKKAAEGRGDFEKLSYLIGYCPLDKVGSLEKIAESEKWGLIVEDPSENDNVPTLVRNPRWIEIIRPVFKMIGTIPGYKEVDISMWFLLFFSVFFGMLVGDAGYGLIFFIATLFCNIKFAKKVENKSIFFLIYTLSICAIIWGVLTGTFFGQAWLPRRVGPLLPLLRNNANVQALCFFIGSLHLSIAHLWRFIRKMPSVKAFSEVGWICMLWLAYFIAKTLILGQVFPEAAKWLLIIGPGLIILCTNPSKNIFKTISRGLGGFLIHVVSSFTDVVSYIRLFAVGAATVAVADAFNQMASGIGHGNLLTGLLTAVVLLFGHTLNIMLCAMAVLVHGVRLNVLEFSSHLNMEWSGTEYVPFKQEGN